MGWRTRSREPCVSPLPAGGWGWGHVIWSPAVGGNGGSWDSDPPQHSVGRSGPTESLALGFRPRQSILQPRLSTFCMLKPTLGAGDTAVCLRAPEAPWEPQASKGDRRSHTQEGRWGGAGLSAAGRVRAGSLAAAHSRGLINVCEVSWRTCWLGHPRRAQGHAALSFPVSAPGPRGPHWARRKLGK